MQVVIKCTVAIPIYNRKSDVLNRNAIDSAMEQPCKDMQILVIDDCSTDGTWELLRQVRDPRLCLVRNERNLGLFGNFNRCLELAEGEYVRLLCSDDRLMPDCLGREIALLDRYPGVALLLTRGRRVDEKGRILGLQGDHFQEGIYPGPTAIRSALWFQSHYALNPFNYPSGMLLRRETVLSAGRFDTAMRMSGDVDFFLRMLEYGDLAVWDQLGCEITIHENQEGARLAGDVAIVRETIDITERYRTLLERAGMYSSVRTQLSAYALGMAFKYWRTGLPEAARTHWELARETGVPPWKIAAGVLRLLGLRLWMRASGRRLMPDRPRSPLIPAGVNAN